MVKLKRKVTIKTKHAVEETNVTTQPVGENGNEPKSRKPWLWIAVAALVVIAGIIGFMQMNPSSGNDEGGGAVAAAADTTAAEKTDSAQTAAAQTEADSASASAGEDAAPGAEASAEATDNAAAPETTKANTATAQQNPSSETAAAPQSQSTGTVEDEARQVIRGVYGNGFVRKQNLGNRYAEIQGKVNEMYRNGQVR